jgi:membrane fusion protein (multidrug efflux system)
MSDPSTELFRAEALRYHHGGRNGAGDVLRISPEWIPAAYWLLLVVIATAVAYGTLGTLTEYATGPAVVRVEGRTHVTAASASTVASVDVQPGQRVAAGAVLVTLSLADRAGELERLNREFDLQTIKFLRDPADQAARASLTTLRAERQLARTRVEEQWLKAPQSGIVSDIRIRPGQHLMPGDQVLSLLGDDMHWVVIAMLPGHARPQLRPGTRMRLELTGYRYAYRDVAIQSVGDEIVGPTEVRQYLGQEIADAVPVTGPAVLVKAQLPSNTFLADGVSLSYYEGMIGTVDARLHRQPIFLTIIPALKSLFRHADS